jgi:hypothetical protein
MTAVDWCAHADDDTAPVYRSWRGGPHRGVVRDKGTAIAAPAGR